MALNRRIMIAAALLLLGVMGAAGAVGQDAGANAEAKPGPGPDKAGAATAEAPPPFLGGFLRETRILYPLKLGQWTAVDEHRYDDPNAGVSVRYLHGDDSDRWADVYFYPVGVLTDDEVRQVAESERNGLKQVWMQGPDAKDDDISGLRRYSFEPKAAPDAEGGEKPEPRTAYAVDFTFESKGDRRNSAMVVLFQDMYMLKTRYSVKHQAASRKALLDELEGFTAELANTVSISSTGGCWRPLSIEPLVAGQPIPDGTLMSMETNGTPTEYVYPDRVLARDPSSISAKAAAMMGMAMADRLYPGCVGPDPVNPVVPEGMREIRIEYRVPTDGASPSSGVGPARIGTG